MEEKKWSKESVSGDSILPIHENSLCPQILFAVNWTMFRLSNPNLQIWTERHALKWGSMAGIPRGYDASFLKVKDV